MAKKHPMQNKKLKLKQTISLMKNTNRRLLRWMDTLAKRRDEDYRRGTQNYPQQQTNGEFYDSSDNHPK